LRPHWHRAGWRALAATEQAQAAAAITVNREIIIIIGLKWEEHPRSALTRQAAVHYKSRGGIFWCSAPAKIHW
jgi:hypothetical protein